VTLKTGNETLIYSTDTFPLTSLMDLKVLSLNTPHILLHRH